MSFMRTFIVAALLFCAGSASATGTKTIAQTVPATPSLSTLASALAAADLVDYFNKSGTFTVFAPTNAAFAALPAGTLDDLLKPANKAKLVDFLQYHVLDSVVESKDLAGKVSVTSTLDKYAITAVGNATGTFVNDAKITTIDVRTSNGAVHIIDKVLSAPTVVNIADYNPNASTLVAAIKAADLVTTLSGTGPFTVFAPTNAAFAALPDGTLANLLKPENKAQLVDILKYHVISGAAFNSSTIAADVGKDSPPTMQGGVHKITKSGSNPMLGAATVIAYDAFGTNGIVHVIDKVLLPPASSATSAASSSAASAASSSSTPTPSAGVAATYVCGLLVAALALVYSF